MQTLPGGQTDIQTQLSLFDAVKDLLLIDSIFLFGIVLIGALFIVIFKKESCSHKARAIVSSGILYYYLCLMLTHIVGIPTLNEYIRLTNLGEAFFNPNINLIPFIDGLSTDFILNIILFIPLGLLCPLISRTFERTKNIFFVGFGLSFFIEAIQLFTLHRATDINDLLANVTGTMIGYFCFRLIAGLSIMKPRSNESTAKRSYGAYIPVIIIIIALILGFFS